MPKFFWDIEQGSSDWYKVRAGIPTASEFDSIMTPEKRKPSESRKRYACALILQRLMRWQPDSLTKIDAIADGKANEPLAIGQLEIIHEIQTHKVGFVTTSDGRFGCSPDRVAGISQARDAVDICIEAKCPTLLVQMERFLFPKPAYMVQRQGQLLVSDADTCIFYSFNPQTPAINIRHGRDEPFIKDLRDCLERFSDELEEWTLQAKRWGPFQVFDEIVTPTERDLGPSVRGAAALSREMTDEELDDYLNLTTIPDPPGFGER